LHPFNETAALIAAVSTITPAIAAAWLEALQRGAAKAADTELGDSLALFYDRLQRGRRVIAADMSLKGKRVLAVDELQRGCSIIFADTCPAKTF
jgi:hypothetical protein